MKPSLLKLQKFIKLEAERGYDNRAIMGGFERILDSWEAEARGDGASEELIQFIHDGLHDYGKHEMPDRPEIIKKLWEYLHAASGTTLQPLPAPTVREPRTEPAVSRSKEPPPNDVPSGEEYREYRAPHRPARSSPRATNIPAAETIGALSSPTTVLDGVGKVHARTLSRLGLHTLRDILYYFPRRYIDYTQLKPINRLWYGEEVTVIGTVQSLATRPTRSGQQKITEAVISDGTGALRVTWFNPYLARKLHGGAHIVISGKIDQYLGRLTMNNPELESLDQQQLSTNRIVPVYSLTAQITQRWLRKLLNQVVAYWAPRLPDHLPDFLRRGADLMDLSQALMQIHFPDSWEKLKAARHRLAFDEIFLLQLGVLGQKRLWQERTANTFEVSEEWLSAQIARLPFELTGAQTRAIADVRLDLASARPMNRLLQGDVGSGKTVVAATAIGMVVQHGAQAALMAPTSILAEQHYKSMLQLLSGEQDEAPLPLEAIRLMIGSTPEADKREIREGLAGGSIKLVIGTHALLEEPVTFADLELAVVDEQHRFGVEQRAALRAKGANPHLLVMTATPIPRSLALTVYGDLDLSIMDEMPAGRQPVQTFVVAPLERERAYRLVCNQIDAGHQAFFIYPLVEESEQSDSKAAVEEHARLQADVFTRYKLGLVHGRLRPDEKEDVMTRFHKKEYDILVSTSVVEVGVDVPNATVMIIEGANRFGLAQLHQFRGRVGRSESQSYCVLIPESEDASENERLQVMTQTTDGFVLAERDLEQRGPGDFLGTRQSGYAELQLANLTDIHLIEKARRQAHNLFEQDPELKSPANQLLSTAVTRFWGGGKGDIS